MSKLKIERNDKYFYSDSFAHGRIAKIFFDKLTEVVFEKNWKTYAAYNNNFPNESFFPLLQSERMQYAMFGSALSEITPIYMSECPFNKSEIGDQIDKNRRVDFWCLSKNGVHGKAINFFIELKKAYYCTSAGTCSDLTADVSAKIRELIRQLETIKNDARPDWPGDGNVYLGIVVLHGYRNSGKTTGFDQSVVADEVVKEIDGRKGIHMLMNTWVPTMELNAESPWENGDICEFVSIIGFMLSRKAH